MADVVSGKGHGTDCEHRVGMYGLGLVCRVRIPESRYEIGAVWECVRLFSRVIAMSNVFVANVPSTLCGRGVNGRVC